MAMIPLREINTYRRFQRTRRGFTLAELVVSMAVFTILAGSVVTAIMLATRAIPDPDSTLNRRLSAQRALDQMSEELFYAVDITSSSVTSAGVSTIEFTVADRGHGLPGLETIRYSWSGTPGDPLIRQYNDSAAETVIESVQRFEVAFEHKILRLTRPPIVLMITDDPPGAQIADRQTLMESWGWTVLQHAAVEPDTALRAATNSSDVVYITRETLNEFFQLLSKLGSGGSWNTTRGLVTELGLSYDDLGISTGSTLIAANIDTVTIIDNTHEITDGFAAGDLIICGSAQPLVQSLGTIAPGLTSLATVSNQPSLGFIEVEQLLHTGVKTPGRRVKLPWGRLGFNFNALNANGKSILKRSLYWAAQPNVHIGAQVKLRLTDDPQGPMKVRTRILNQPRCQEESS